MLVRRKISQEANSRKSANIVDNRTVFTLFVRNVRPFPRLCYDVEDGLLHLKRRSRTYRQKIACHAENHTTAKPYSPTIQSFVASTNSLLYRIEIITRKRLDEIPYNFSMIRRGSWHKSRDYRGSIVDETIYRRGSRDARTAGGNVTRRLEYVAAGITGNWSVTITSDAYFSGGYARPVRHNKVI